MNLRIQNLIIILFVVASTGYSQDEIRTFHRPQQADIEDRLKFIRNVLGKPKLDSEMISTLEGLRIRAEEIATTNFECNAISINQIPNPRCKTYYLKTLPDFEKEYSSITGNYYINRTSLIKTVSDKRSKINECIQAMESFLTIDYSPEKFAIADVESINIEPIDDQNISVSWRIRKHIDENRSGMLRSRVQFWNENCDELKSSPYFQSQARKHFENSPFQIDGNFVWYNSSWQHQVSVNGRKIFDESNPTATRPHLDLSNGNLLWKWNEIVDGVIELREGGIAAVAQNIIVQSAPLIEHFIDNRDNQIYGFAKIGNSKWMMQNLAFPTANNKWCYNNDTLNCKRYGYLYNWNSAMIACPKGWRLPSENDWENLVKFAGGFSKLKDYTFGNGTNRIGFRILPGGRRGRMESDTIFSDSGVVAFFWTATEPRTGQAASVSLPSYQPWEDFASTYVSKSRGFSVRCIQ